ncbi:hypothetical protein ES711_02255 [Gelidibacter salicanalis]|uniref:Uncharacterized protein n=1 Tax=Gelidibacter salicanalis TaxID=291193 RepID=A0A5C7AQY5_9FLAO|nr:hypothetical protein [Gelidibacter salicanalis]TXE10751.1 hypothetical protein ES711_02255 [Gelidibacter salicanalis]
MKRTELYWFIGTLSVVILLYLVLFGTEGFQSDATTTIAIYDTYIIVATIYVILILLVIALFCVYLFRSLRYKFKNVTANVILAITTVLLAYILMKLMPLADIINS